MDSELLPRQVSELTAIAAQTGRGTDDLVRRAVDQLNSENERLRLQAQVDLEQIERGEVIDEDVMAERVDRLLRR